MAQRISNSAPDPDVRIARIAARQHGVFTRNQALASGLTDSMIRLRLDVGRWALVHRGVYRLCGSAITRHQQLLAGVFAWGDGALLSHRAAADLWGFPKFKGASLEVTIPRSNRHSGPGRFHRTRLLLSSDSRTKNAIPLTSPERTVLDLASLIRTERVTPAELEHALDAGLRLKQFSLERMQWRIDLDHKKTGSAIVQRMVDERRLGRVKSASPLETDFYLIVRASPLPLPVPQFEIWHEGRLLGRPDYAFVDYRLAVEAYGYEHHFGRLDWSHDVTRGNDFVAVGWETLVFTKEDLEDPARIIETCARALRARGWTGYV